MSEQLPAPLTAQALERLAGAIRVPTVSEREDALFGRFQEFLADSYPRFFATVESVHFGPRALVCCWRALRAPAAQEPSGLGPNVAEPHSTGRPVLFLSHYDVVPVEADKWSGPPFGGELRDGFLWGRGTLDTKTTLFWTLEAAESLMASGFVPTRDIWFAFGGDEEVSGFEGAQKVAAWFAEQGIRFSWLLDEGSIVAQDMLSMVKEPLALVSVEEKGYLDVEVSVEQASGHASRPPQEQAAAVLGRALSRLAKKPFPWSLTPGVEGFFRSLSGLVTGIQKPVLRNARALGPLFFPLSASSDATRALLRTTLAMTQLEGSRASNVMPRRVSATLNLRLLSPWTIEKALDFSRRVIADDRVALRVKPGSFANDPIPCSPACARGESEGWDDIRAAIGVAFPDAAILPFLNTATTDSRHYASLCDAIYRFAPMRLTPGELSRIHSEDERISLENIAAGLVFYNTLMGRLCTRIQGAQ